MTASKPDLEYAMFSRAEMDRRLARARAFMAERDLDGLFITQDENFQYFSGTSATLALTFSLTRPSIFILPREGEPIIVSQGRQSIKLGCYVEDLRGYTDLLTFPHALVGEALADAGLARGRIGVELGQEQRLGMPVADYLKLVSDHPAAEFVDAAPLLIRLRMVKSEEELVYLRRSAEMTGRARQRVFDQLRPGATERDVDRMLRAMMLEEGAERTSFVILQSETPGAGNPFKYERALEPGSVLAVDGGAFAGMYSVDYCRMATLGRATNLQKRVHGAVLEVNQVMIDALRPGITCSELFGIGLKAIDAAGVERDAPGPMLGRMGHGQGMLITEPPSVAHDDQTVLEPGTVISTEPGVCADGVSFVWEDVHVVTETGSEKLTLETPELRELDW